jgi:hypothetical protein
MDVSIARQAQINEWEYNSKRETLFISQLFFIGISFVIILFTLARFKFIRLSIVYFVAIILIIIFGIFWYLKHIYTRNTRDKKHWNRKVFDGDHSKVSTIPASVLAQVAKSATDSCENCDNGLLGL